MANTKIFKTKKRNNRKFKRTFKKNGLNSIKNKNRFFKRRGGALPMPSPYGAQPMPSQPMPSQPMPGQPMVAEQQTKGSKNNTSSRNTGSSNSNVTSKKPSIVYDVDGTKIDLKTIESEKNKECKESPALCASIKFSKEVDKKAKLFPDEDGFGYMIDVPHVTKLKPKSKYGLKNNYKKMCLGAQTYEPPKPDIRQYFSLPSETNMKKFGVSFFYPHFIDSIVSQNPYDLMNKMKQGISGIGGQGQSGMMPPGQSGMMPPGQSGMMPSSRSRSSVRRQRGGKKKSRKNKKYTQLYGYDAKWG